MVVKYKIYIFTVLTLKNNIMKFMVIEMWKNLPTPMFVTDEDGNVKTFETFEEAKIEADECQDGLVITDENY